MAALTAIGRWEVDTLEGLDAHLHLPSIAGTVSLADVYERIVFPARVEGGHEAKENW